MFVALQILSEMKASGFPGQLFFLATAKITLLLLNSALTTAFVC